MLLNRSQDILTLFEVFSNFTLPDGEEKIEKLSHKYCTRILEGGVCAY